MAKHLVLDIDECLIRTFMEPTDMRVLEMILKEPRLYHLRDRICIVRDTEGRVYWSIKRPNLDTFLEFAFDEFETVSIWSAGSPGYVREIVPQIFANTRPPVLVMTGEDVMWESDIKYSKPLERYYEMMRENTRYRPTRSNTLFLDNRLENFVNDPQNGVHIPNYEPRPTVEDIASQEDDNLLSFIHFLRNVCHGDITAIDKSNIFGRRVSQEQVHPKKSSRFRDVTYNIKCL